MSNEQLRLGGLILRDRRGNIQLLDPHTNREIFEIEAADVEDFVAFALANKRRNIAKALHPSNGLAAVMAHVRQEDTASGQKQ